MTALQFPLLAQAHRNRQLFSDHYLNVLLPQRADWRMLAPRAKPVLDAIAAIFAAYGPDANEAQTERYLVRPALERLRDLAALGGVDRLYVQAPDRLARKYAHQVLVLEELARAGVTVVFLNRAVQQTPEDELLVQVQGVIAAYELAKIMERSRRGRRHAARLGSLSVLAHAPYGYRYVGKPHGADPPRYEIALDEARVVRQIFEWVGRERLTLSGVCLRLGEAGIPTRTGKRRWDRATIWDTLKNPAYKGEAAYGRTCSGPYQPRALRPQRGKRAQPRRAVSVRSAPREE